MVKNSISVSGYKINLEKQGIFLYINNKHIEKEIIHIPTHNSLKVNKISRIKPNKEVKDLYNKLNKEIEKDIKKNGNTFHVNDLVEFRL